LEKLIGLGLRPNQLREDVELNRRKFIRFDTRLTYLGKIAQCFFGSAVNNFGINEMLRLRLLKIALCAEKLENSMSGKFKPMKRNFFRVLFLNPCKSWIPNHRNRIAFPSNCQKNLSEIKPYQPCAWAKAIAVFQRDSGYIGNKTRKIIDEAFPG